MEARIPQCLVNQPTKQCPGVLQILRNDGKGAEGGIIILMTDGEENTGPYAEEVLPELENSTFTVNTVAYGNSAASVLEELASKTNGIAFSLSDDQTDIQVAMQSVFETSSYMVLSASQRPETVSYR